MTVSISIESVKSYFPVPIVKLIEELTRNGIRMETLDDFACWIADGPGLRHRPNVNGLTLFKTKLIFRAHGLELAFNAFDETAIVHFFAGRFSRITAAGFGWRQRVFGAEHIRPSDLSSVLRALSADYLLMIEGSKLRRVLVFPREGHERGTWLACERVFGRIPVETAGKLLRKYGVPL